MPLDRLTTALDAHVAGLDSAGTAKGAEVVVNRVQRASGESGPRFFLEGQEEKPFIRMNSNSYLGLGLRDDVIEAEEHGSAKYGAGPGAVRFISGTYDVHTRLEQRLADFHGRESAMAFSSAYATVVSTIVSLVTKDTVLISDELNHNCIINAMRLARPAGKGIYGHNDVAGLEKSLQEWVGKAKRAIVVTDGIFSMRGDHAPLKEIQDVCHRFDEHFEENVVLLVDDSHGVGAFGETGRGTEEYTASGPVDILIGTLGKAFGVNGGYVTSSESVIRFLRESSPMYIYSNPITPGEANACIRALDVTDSEEGRQLLAHLRAMTQRFEDGLGRIGIETIPGAHPVVPLMIRDTKKTKAMVRYLFDNGVLATGLAYPVVPQGDEEIRCQVNADHTPADIDRVLEILAGFEG